MKLRNDDEDDLIQSKFYRPLFPHLVPAEPPWWDAGMAVQASVRHAMDTEIHDAIINEIRKASA